MDVNMESGFATRGLSLTGWQSTCCASILIGIVPVGCKPDRSGRQKRVANQQCSACKLHGLTLTKCDKLSLARLEEL